MRAAKEIKWSKKICFLATMLFVFPFIFCNDPLKIIAQEIEKDLQDCSDKQDCISKIDKHLANLKQLHDQLENSMIPYTFFPSRENISTLLKMNFAPALLYLAAKLYNVDTQGPSLMMGILTSLWGLSTLNDYGYRAAKLVQLASWIRFLENKKQGFE